MSSSLVVLLYVSLTGAFSNALIYFGIQEQDDLHYLRLPLRFAMAFFVAEHVSELFMQEFAFLNFLFLKIPRMS